MASLVDFSPSFFSEVLAPEIGKAQSSHWGCHAFKRPSSSSSSSSSLLQSPSPSAKSNQKNHWTVKKKGQNVTIWRHCNMQRFPSTFNIQQPGKYKKNCLYQPAHWPIGTKQKDRQTMQMDSIQTTRPHKKPCSWSMFYFARFLIFHFRYRITFTSIIKSSEE